MKKISVLIAGQHSTSVSLEADFFNALVDIAIEQKISINELITRIDAEREVDNLSSALRLFVLHYYQEKINAAKKKGRK